MVTDFRCWPILTDDRICVFVSSILFWVPQCMRYFWRVFRFLFLERKQDSNVTSVKTTKDISTKNSEPTYWTILFVNPRHLGTWTSRYSVLDISVLTWTSRYWTVRDLDETIFLTDHNCLVLINCQYFCTSSSLIYMNQKCFW